MASLAQQLPTSLAAIREALWSSATASIHCLLTRWRASGATSRTTRFCRGAMVGLVTTYLLSMWRLLPDRVLRGLFGLHIVISLISSNVAIAAINVLRAAKVLSNDTASGCCATATAACFRWSRWMSPHVPVKMLPGSLPSFASMVTPNAVLVNHTSFMDTVLFLWVVNPTYMMQMKTFYKAQLASIPLLRTILLSSEMLPVYFVSDEHTEFRVDRDKQAMVLEATDRFMRRGGSVSLYPEGAINRKDVRTLSTFRIGSFKKILEHRLRVYYMLHAGSQKVWAPKEAVGGHPATIYVFYGEIAVDYDDPALDPSKLAAICEAEMQTKLQWMHQEIDSIQRR